MCKFFKSQKGIGTILIFFMLVGIVIAGGTIYYVIQKGKGITPSAEKQPITPQPPVQEKITDWKTYSNPRAPFTFKYPQDWQTEERAAGKVEDKNRDRWIGYFFSTARAQSIELPDGWEITGEGYYTTPAGVKAGTYTVVIAPIGYLFSGNDPSKPSDPFIVINERQFNCYGKEWWGPDMTHIDLVFSDSPNFRWLLEYVKYRTLEGEEKITGTNYIATCSKDAQVLEIFDKIAKSFKPVPPIE